MRPRSDFKAAVIGGGNLKEKISSRYREWVDNSDSVLDWFEQDCPDRDKYELIFDLSETDGITLEDIDTKFISPILPSTGDDVYKVKCADDDKLAFLEAMLDFLAGELVADWADWSDMEAVISQGASFATLCAPIEEIKEIAPKWLMNLETNGEMELSISGDITLLDLQDVVDRIPKAINGGNCIPFVSTYYKTVQNGQMRISAWYRKNI